MEVGTDNRPGLSLKWDFALPVGIVLVPICCFALMGWLFKFFLNQHGPLPGWLVGVTMVLQITGLVTMAIAALMRREQGMQDLNFMFPDGPPAWRCKCLLLSVICVTVFEVLANLATAFAGAGVFVLPAAAFYGLYLLLIRVAFRRSSPMAEVRVDAFERWE